MSACVRPIKVLQVKPQKERWQLTFETVDSDGLSPLVNRVRSLLKTALRAYGLRCVDHRITQEAEPPKKEHS